LGNSICAEKRRRIWQRDLTTKAGGKTESSHPSAHSASGFQEALGRLQTADRGTELQNALN